MKQIEIPLLFFSEMTGMTETRQLPQDNFARYRTINFVRPAETQNQAFGISI
jgi:hypothetical protein